jgi:uncharacterized protein involved in exopolysaccharide biosynthesis/Mrp family chromosome partitioning ATPase
MTGMEIFDRQLPSENAYRISGHASRLDPDYDPVRLREVVAKFWIRRWFIFGWIIICAGVSFGVAKMTTPIYMGEAEIMIRPEQAGAAAANASILAAIQGGPEAVPSEAIVLQSRDLAGKTIERLNLDRDPEFNPSLRELKRFPALFDPVFVLLDTVRNLRQELGEFLSGASENDGIGAAAEPDQQSVAGMPSTAVVNALISNLRVDVVPHSNVIQVSFKSSHPTTAAAVPNTLVELYLDQLADEKDKALVQERKRLDTLVLPTLRAKMNASQRALAEYRQKSGLVIDQTPTVLGQELSDINAQLSAARARKAEATARLSQIQALVSSPGQPATSGTTSPAAASESVILQQLRNQEVELKAQLSALRGEHGPNYPRTQQLAAELDEVRGAVRRESAGLVGRLRAEVAASESMEAALNRRQAEFTRQFALVNGGDIQLQNLVRDADADRQTYERYLARSNEIYADMGHAQPDAKLVSQAAVPLKPSFPNTRLMVMLGAVIGAGMGITLAALVDLLRGGLRSKQQVEDALGVKCLGSLPMLKRSRLNRRSAPFLQPQNSAFTEAVRSVELKLLSFDRQDSRVVLVTAALPDEGKTWVAASLAACLAADGVSVVLVDCDLHRPTVHRMFDGPRGPGLADYFAGDAALNEIVHDHRVSGVRYIPAGSALSRGARITPGRLRPLIDRLAKEHTFVILDSAPVLAVSETMLLSQLAEKTILVVKWGSTPLAVARHAATQLLDSSGTEIGVLLSMVDPRRAAKYGDLSQVYNKLESYYGR